MIPSVHDVVSGARFFAALPAFFHSPVDLEEAQRTLRDRLEHRERDFLALARDAIYAHEDSPYLSLLRNAACQYGDLERLVGQEGLEGTLRVLYREGVYLTVDEFKGHRAVERGSFQLTVELSALQNRSATLALAAHTGGSRSSEKHAPLHLPSYRERTVDHRLELEARGAMDWRHAIWGVPGTTALGPLLEWGAMGVRPVRWFWQVDPGARGLHPRYKWSARVLRWGSLLGGVRLPTPEYVPIDRPLPIAQWMATSLRTGATPHLLTFVASAVRVCEAALGAGLDLNGAQFTTTGEPITLARLATIRRAGAHLQPMYGAGESGLIGKGCLAPQACDEIHLCHDLNAVVQPGPHARDDLPATAVLISSLRPTAQFILLNVSLGDTAVMGQRACGCPLEQLGWTTHLQTIRSFEKLTAGGMSFLDTDVISVLEELLPARFGGGPTDYQLVERETAQGQPRLGLLVHPRVGPVDEDAVVDAFLSAIGGGSGAEHVMELAWRQAGFVQVERREPVSTVGGKILHLHVNAPLPA